MTYDYDFFVIGAGPGGASAAKRAAKYGAKVAIAERENLGGVCTNRGCIPKKLMVYAGDFADLVEDADGYGWDLVAKGFNWQRFVAARNQHVERIHAAQQRALDEAGIELIRASARFIDGHRLQVGDRQITARNILIAVGGKPNKPPIEGIEHAMTSKEIFDIDRIPHRIAIIGAGYIGVEFASMFSQMGADVFIMNIEACILQSFDDDIRFGLRDALMQRGIHSFCSTTANKIEPVADGLRLTLEGDCPDRGDCPKEITVDRVLCATGRSANLEDLGLEQAGVEANKKAIAVNDYSRTSQEHIYAVGDCTGRLGLTPVATAEGRAVADTLFGDRPQTVDYRLVPTSIFARPEAASVGLTEKEAREDLGDDRVRCCRTRFTPLFNSLTQSYKREQQALFKVVVDQESDRVVGIHAIGPHAAEIIQSLAAAMKMGITKSKLDETIGIHPTIGEELFLIYE
ncbi:MAG: glutathione-disulfide reductase [Synechococcales bacterium]|nr:glutathione-disulfide reductase [Synechococcales bacterium]